MSYAFYHDMKVFKLVVELRKWEGDGIEKIGRGIIWRNRWECLGDRADLLLVLRSPGWIGSGLGSAHIGLGCWGLSGMGGLAGSSRTLVDRLHNRGMWFLDCFFELLPNEDQQTHNLGTSSVQSEGPWTLWTGQAAVHYASRILDRILQASWL
jgi:hypothetical protein